MLGPTADDAVGALRPATTLLPWLGGPVSLHARPTADDAVGALQPAATLLPWLGGPAGSRPQPSGSRMRRLPPPSPKPKWSAARGRHGRSSPNRPPGHLPFRPDGRRRLSGLNARGATQLLPPLPPPAACGLVPQAEGTTGRGTVGHPLCPTPLSGPVVGRARQARYIGATHDGSLPSPCLGCPWDGQQPTHGGRRPRLNPLSPLLPPLTAHAGGRKDDLLAAARWRGEQRAASMEGVAEVGDQQRRRGDGGG